MRFFLIGMPGSGKTFWGKKVADFLNLEFIDLDNEIVKSENKTIQQIFQQKGETLFRKIENFTLKNIINRQTDFVLACGGGTPCFLNNLNMMKNTGKVFYLHTSIKYIAKNILDDHSNKRPLLKFTTEKELIENLTLILNERIDFYKQADIIIDIEKWNETQIFNTFVF